MQGRIIDTAPIGLDKLNSVSVINESNGEEKEQKGDTSNLVKKHGTSKVWDIHKRK